MLVNEQGDINWEIIILEPITFKVNILRNLSSGWYHGVPDMEVSGLLESIQVSVVLVLLPACKVSQDLNYYYLVTLSFISWSRNHGKHSGF